MKQKTMEIKQKIELDRSRTEEMERIKGKQSIIQNKIKKT
jgi:hypothetical protein